MSGSAKVPSVLDRDAVAEAAARWVLRRKEGLNAREEEAFAQWLQADSGHRAAFEDSLRGWEAAGSAAASPDILKLRSEALMIRPRPAPRFGLAASLAVLAILGASSAAFLLPGSRSLSEHRAASTIRSNIYQTAVGERSGVTLEDGSVVTLNTSSRLEVRYSRQRRDLLLLAGQALFQVAHDQARPFIVSALDREVVATGTEFEVRVDRGSLRVALLHGHVEVRPAPKAPSGSAGASPAQLAPGEQLVADAGRRVRVSPADVMALTSWREGRVRFEDTLLSEAAAEMNRYSRTPIVIEDARAAKIRISGAFRTGRSEEFAAAVASLFPVRASQSGGAIRLRSAA